MSALICGSLAFDNIMQYGERFADALLPDQLHNINVSFLVPTMRREFGGCAGNIGYNLQLLGGEPIIMATVGQDGQAYLDRLTHLGMSTAHIRTIADSFTAQCFITTDRDGNQITAFHPGAMSYSHENKIADAKGARIAIVAPDGRDGMVQHAQQCAEQGIPLLFDPGQGMPMFSGEELKQFISIADYIALNEYESQMLVARTGLAFEEVAKQVKALIITHGEKGAQIYTDGKQLAIPAVPASTVADPTGCGDAFRSGILYGLTHDLDWETSGRLASLMGSIKVVSQGPQNHAPSRDEIHDRFKAAFGYDFA